MTPPACRSSPPSSPPPCTEVVSWGLYSAVEKTKIRLGKVAIGFFVYIHVRVTLLEYTQFCSKPNHFRIPGFSGVFEA